MGLTGAAGPAGPQGTPGLNYRDGWVNTTTYNAGDVVFYNGSSWVALDTNTNDAPDPVALVHHWSYLAQEGATGPAGATGATGPTGATGSPGPAGSTGPAGPTGPSGPTGQTGSPGATGATGPEGFVTLPYSGGATTTANVPAFVVTNGSTAASAPAVSGIGSGTNAGGAFYGGNTASGTGGSGVYGQGGSSQAGSAGTGVYGLGGFPQSGSTEGGFGVTGQGASIDNTFSKGTGGFGGNFIAGNDGSTSGGSGGIGVNTAGGNSANGAGGDGIDAFAGTGPGGRGFAAEFFGDTQVIGNLAKSGGSFKIDHPLDPENKYLYHSFVESPDMKNIYDGVARLGADGTAWVTLPNWFEALNSDFRYQLTAVGKASPGMYIAAEVAGNQFQIAGGAPGVRVSWQVTGIRKDAYANAHRIPLEVEKPAQERGTYLSPDSFGQPESKAVYYDRLERMRQKASAQPGFKAPQR